MGITYDSVLQRFVFDFEHDGAEDIMLRYIYRFAQPTLRKTELVKALPANISFDMMQFLWFDSKADEELYASIRNQNMLIIDDVATSGSTINEILRSLRILNEDNDIAIFSLIGRKDLMTDANW